MSEKIFYISQDGLDKLKAELHELKTVKVRETSSRIEQAKALGDLKENAEYHSAKDEMGFIQGRIREIEEMLKNVSVIQDVAGSSTVRIGSKVEVEAKDVVKNYKIVGSEEANPASGLISNESPMGRAFLGHAPGDKVEVETPGGIVIYTILNIS
ncbi:MAG TPA: transcription elongation factor GreA [bacterium]|nr:MAG: Transcription elongation factor GreA [Parcubacteria group bacterium ADurb.Bin192]HPN14926.1 transcription elongation factor GreA [bacterium]